MSSQCKNCNAEIKWKNEDDKWIPLNMDDTDHKNTCTAKPAAKYTSKYTPSKFGIEKAPEIYNLAEGMLDSFYKKRTNGSDNDIPPKLPVDQEAIFIESMFKTLSSSYKP